MIRPFLLTVLPVLVLVACKLELTGVQALECPLPVPIITDEGATGTYKPWCAYIVCLDDGTCEIREPGVLPVQGTLEELLEIAEK